MVSLKPSVSGPFVITGASLLPLMVITTVWSSVVPAVSVTRIV